MKIKFAFFGQLHSITGNKSQSRISFCQPNFSLCGRFAHYLFRCLLIARAWWCWLNCCLFGCLPRGTERSSGRSREMQRKLDGQWYVNTVLSWEYHFFLHESLLAAWTIVGWTNSNPLLSISNCELVTNCEARTWVEMLTVWADRGSSLANTV